MEISYKHRFIFIHVYKVGGISMSEALKPYAYDPDRFIVHVPVLRRLLKKRTELFRKIKRHNWGHAKAKELKEALPPELFNSFYKFTFVRNPWDYLVSVYHYIVQTAHHPRNELFRSFGSFAGYVEYHATERREQQKDFVLSDSGELLVDFIGHYETLQQDFETVCRRIGIDSRLPHKNRSTHKDFRDYYTPETRAQVAELYRGDIEFFGYDFDNSQTLPPILSPAEQERLKSRHGGR